MWAPHIFSIELGCLHLTEYHNITKVKLWLNYDLVVVKQYLRDILDATAFYRRQKFPCPRRTNL